MDVCVRDFRRMSHVSFTVTTKVAPCCTMLHPPRHKVMAALAEAKNATKAATTEEADASNQKLKAPGEEVSRDINREKSHGCFE